MSQPVNNTVLSTINKQNARERLLEAGIALFAEKGYASTSVREIVARAGVTKPVLYYYFFQEQKRPFHSYPGYGSRATADLADRSS
jgi:hypothetical protein